MPKRFDIRACLPVFAALLTSVTYLPADVVINEFVAASNERRLSWDAEGVARVGTGYRWAESAFDASGWSNTLLPAGYGFTGLAMDLTSQMKDKTPSLYLRKEFQVLPAHLESSRTLSLWVQYNDGFIAYLNGREVARANCGPRGHFLFASEPACNVSTTNNLVEFPLGPASTWLAQGLNLLSIQAHNGEQPSTTNDPSRIVKHLPTPEFRINAGLRLAASSNSPATDLIIPGPTGGAWKYFVGRAEPSGGLVDVGLLTRTFTPPDDEENEDYDQPSAFCDWVELHNNGPEPVDLSGWSLTDNAEVPGKWCFPTNTVIPGGGFRVVLCDDRDEANPPAGPATHLHASFRLNDEKGQLLLFDELGRHVDGFTLSYPPQVSFCSYGRVPANPAEFGYLATATPGATNAGVSFGGRVEPVQFQDSLGTNLPGGIYLNRSFQLYLRHVLPSALIRYTTNGSEPTEWNGFTYTNPLTLYQSNDKTGIVVRARALLPQHLPSKVTTHTYVLRRPSALATLPLVALTGDPGRDIYAPDGVLAIVGGKYVTVSSGAIWQANGPSSYNWALGNGDPFERETCLEYYFPSGIYPTNQGPWRGNIGLRLSASSYSRPRMKLLGTMTNSPWSTSSSVEKPSFNFFFNGDFGPGELDYNLFTNYTVRKFEHLRCRAGKNDIRNPFITDEMVRRLWLDMGQAGSRGLFCSLYVNGVYKGLYNLCQRFREQLFQAHFRSQEDWDVNYIRSWVDGDNVAFNQILSALDLNLASLPNWQSVSNKIDLDNAADYYLLNIYCAMWDWPGNNYVIARERSNGPLSRFRFGVWDAEGAFKVLSSAHPVTYNTITNDLIVPSNHKNYSLELPRIFRRLSTSLEFRLWFADRVNRHMFNGGVLDDRDPDGSGPGKSRFLQQLDTLRGEVNEAVKYNSGSSINLAAFNAWINTTNGRRSYLLGTEPGRRMLRDSGFWPLTEPPVFSQHGGTVAPGYLLSMTSSVATAGQTAKIYFTTDNSDPRQFGGVPNPVAQVYSDPIALQQVVTVKARARNNHTGEWSPLTEATFAPAAVPASAANLVIGEIMYHPPDATAMEETGGFSNADSFEFLRILNIGTVAVDLAGVRFETGISFDFTVGAQRYLNPGASLLVVANLAAFQLRYGHGYDSMIAGMYAGNLSNSGEQLRLIEARNITLRDLTYGDRAPWPAVTDGDGPSLILANPGSNPDHADPANWVASAVPGGLPGGGPPAQSYASWRGFYWNPADASDDLISGPAADNDADGFANFLEYTFGLNPRQPSTSPAPLTTIEVIDDEPHLVLVLRLAAGATDASLEWQMSDNLVSWVNASATMELLSSIPSPDGTVLRKYGETSPLQASPARFLRLVVTGP